MRRRIRTRAVPGVVLGVVLGVLLGAASTVRAGDEPAPGESSCTLNCHGKETVAFRHGVHAGVLTCVDCHGGNPKGWRDQAASHAKEAGFKGAPAHEDVPALCGDCHADPLAMRRYGLSTDQLALYASSRHGKAVLERGDPNAAVCTDCHGVHDILRVSDPRSAVAPTRQPATCGRCHSDAKLMAAYDLPADGVARFSSSVHGRALLQDHVRDAPSCSACHGSHGAAPPGMADIVEACGQCHQNTRDAYRKSPHAASPDMRCRACHEDEKGAEYARSGCTACHGAHDIADVGDWILQGEKPGRCAHCHRDGGEAEVMAKRIVDGQRRLRDEMERTDADLRAAKERGLFLDNEKLYVRESQVTLVSVKPLSHSMDGAAIDRHLENGRLRQGRAREMLERKATVLRDRRIVVTGLSLLLLLLAALLVVKLEAIRRLS